MKVPELKEIIAGRGRPDDNATEVVAGVPSGIVIVGRV